MSCRLLKNCHWLQIIDKLTVTCQGMRVVQKSWAGTNAWLNIGRRTYRFRKSTVYFYRFQTKDPCVCPRVCLRPDVSQRKTSWKMSDPWFLTLTSTQPDTDHFNTFIVIFSIHRYLSPPFGRAVFFHIHSLTSVFYVVLLLLLVVQVQTARILH